MAHHNFASYQPGTFSTDVTNLELGDALFQKKDMPAFVHEYCHYIQDITTISSIFGFSLWMRDVVALTRVFSDGEKKNIFIPLDRDQHGETIDKFRKFYSLYCGDSNVYDIDYSKVKFKTIHLSVKNVPIDGTQIKLAINEIELEGKLDKIHFGLIALQEIQAYYAQVMAEAKLQNVEFSVPSSNMKAFPYKFGEFLFEQFDITMGIETKFLLIDMCLDSIQAPTVFLKVLEKLKDQKVHNNSLQRPDLYAIVMDVAKQHAVSNEIA